MAKSNSSSSETLLSIAARENKIATGAENGRLSLWTLDGCEISFCNLESDVTSVEFCHKNTQYLFCSSGHKIYQYDIRNFIKSLKMYNFNDEEINQLSINTKDEFMSVADDNGLVKIINLQTDSLYKTLHKHTNICSSVQFRPHKPWEVVSGGYDKLLIQWDFSRGRPLHILDEIVESENNASLTSYIVNPPFVLSLSFSSDGTFLASGFNSGTIGLYNAKKKYLKLLTTLKVHSKGVSQVHFVNSSQPILISGGNDKKILLWNLTDLHEEVYPKQVITHNSKINWISTMEMNGKQNILVVDQTNNFSIYTIKD